MLGMERCLGERRVRQINRALRNGKLTFLCLLMTFIVLRGTIGAGKFGTPGQDFNEIRHRLHHRHHRSLPHRALVEEKPASTSTKPSTDDSDDPPPDPSKPYSLGPKISDWDQQRAAWHESHPDFPPFLTPTKPRVLLVTGSPPKPCENPVGDHYLLMSIKNKIDYCRVHGIEIFYNMALLDAEMAGFWAKLPLIRKLMLSHPEVEFLWWMDSDAMFTDMAFELPWERYAQYNLVMHGWNEMVYDDKNWIGLNTGSFLLRNCQWALDLLDAWAPMGPKGAIRDEAGKVLTKFLKDRPVFEADDQSAMVYLLATQRDRWREKTYLENHYYLHGYWGILVDRYEEMMDNYHPGFGDHRWPLVTHFVGCKPCGKFGDYPVERCSPATTKAEVVAGEEAPAVEPWGRQGVAEAWVDGVDLAVAVEGHLHTGAAEAGAQEVGGAHHRNNSSGLEDMAADGEEEEEVTASSSRCILALMPQTTLEPTEIPIYMSIPQR